MKSGTLVLTGCAGFIGLNFLKTIVGTEFFSSFKYVLSLDKLGYATKYNKPRYKDLIGQYDIKQFDTNIIELNRQKFHYKLFEAPYTIIDFASESHVDRSISNPFSVYNDNALIPSSLIEWLGGLNGIKTYYHISTDEVFGDLELECKNKSTHYDKWFHPIKSHMNPRNPYAASKAAQDHFLMSLVHTFKQDVKIIRMANQYGPYQYREKFLPASVIRVLNNEPIKIYGKGENCRQWTSVLDTVDIIKDIVSGQYHELFQNNIIHLGDERNLLSNNEIVAMIVDSMKQYNPKVEYIEDRKGHDLLYAIQVREEIQQRYNKADFATRLQDTIKYYVDRKERWKQ